jgi:Ala-tRNA(Pro) deacylase
MNVRQYLDQSRKHYDVLMHLETHSAMGMAQAIHIPGDEVAKPVILKADGHYVMVVIPATYRIDLDKAREAFHVRALELAPETDFGRLFPDCERGARPPFGSQYGMPTVVDEALTRDEQIVFEGNSHREAYRMSFEEFDELERPRMADIARRD